MIHELRKPVPCTTPLGDGYIWYIKDCGYLACDEYAVILCDGGFIRHFTSDQVKIYANDTYKITKADPFK